jgi:hypothetical protein
VPGVKVELVIGLAIASLTVSSINALIGVINFWQGQKKKVYRLTLDASYAASNLDESSSEKLKDAIEAGRPISLIIEKA